MLGLGRQVDSALFEIGGGGPGERALDFEAAIGSQVRRGAYGSIEGARWWRFLHGCWVARLGNPLRGGERRSCQAPASAIALRLRERQDARPGSVCAASTLLGFLGDDHRDSRP
jgi:hypothetical protein